MFLAESETVRTEKFESQLKATIERIEKNLSSETFQESSPDSQNVVQKALALLRQLKDMLKQGSLDEAKLNDTRKDLEEITTLIPDWLREDLEWLLHVWCLIINVFDPYAVECFDDDYVGGNFETRSIKY